MDFSIEQFYYRNISNNTDILNKYTAINILVSLDKYHVFYELGMMLSKTLTKMGYTNSVLVEKSNEYVYETDTLYIIYGADNFILLPNNFIIYHFEQLWRIVNYCPPELIEDMFTQFNKAICIWEYSLSNINLYNQINKITVPIYYVPLGYDSYINYQNTYDYLNKDKNINLSFVGNCCGRRTAIVDTINKRVPISVFSNNVWNYNDRRLSESNPIVDTKAQVFLRTKILINIHMFEPIYASFDLYRTITAIANKCLVISEYSRDITMNKIFDPYIILCNKDDMSNKIAYYSQHENERLNKVNAAYNWLKTKFIYAKFIPTECLNIKYRNFK